MKAWPWDYTHPLLPGFYYVTVYGDNFRTVWKELRWRDEGLT